MGEFEAFLADLTGHGRVVVRGRPGPVREVSREAAGRLERAFEVYRLDLPGPEIPFDLDLAAEAAELVRQACWALVSRADRVEELEKRLTMSRGPKSPSDHASADLLLRYLPQVHRRARAVDPADPLVTLLAGVLARWPLSGVLAGLDEGPATPPDFAGHPGLLLQYAERFAAHGREAWRPAGPGAEFVELVGAGRKARVDEE